MPSTLNGLPLSWVFFVACIRNQKEAPSLEQLWEALSQEQRRLMDKGISPTSQEE